MDNNELHHLQSVLLSMLIDFDHFCAKHGLKYYLEGGTCLGAIRHNGFIPWDDDADVFMTYEDYQRFIKLAPTALDSKYYFERENTPDWPSYHSKIKLNNTTFIEENCNTKSKHFGIFIDIFCFYHAPKDIKLQKKQFKASRLLIAKALSKETYHTDSLKKKLAIFYAKHFISKRKEEKLFAYINKWAKEDTGLYMECFGRGSMENLIYPKDIIDGQSEHIYEDTTLKLCKDPKAYLTIAFGSDYMTPPPSDSQHPSHVQYINFEKAYSYEEVKAFLAK